MHFPFHEFPPVIWCRAIIRFGACFPNLRTLNFSLFLSCFPMHSNMLGFIPLWISAPLHAWGCWLGRWLTLMSGQLKDMAFSSLSSKQLQRFIAFQFGGFYFLFSFATVLKLVCKGEQKRQEGDMIFPSSMRKFWHKSPQIHSTTLSPKSHLFLPHCSQSHNRMKAVVDYKYATP